MPKPVSLSCPVARQGALEAIAAVLGGGPPTDPRTDLASWAVSVEIVEALERDGFRLVHDVKQASASRSGASFTGMAAS